MPNGHYSHEDIIRDATRDLLSVCKQLVDACKFAKIGYENILEFDLLNSKEYDSDTKHNIEILSAAIQAYEQYQR